MPHPLATNLIQPPRHYQRPLPQPSILTRTPAEQFAYHHAQIAGLERALQSEDWQLGRNPDRARARLLDALEAHLDSVRIVLGRHPELGGQP
jgi:hypothetical protein